MGNITNKLITLTESLLTNRKRRKYIKKERHKLIHPVLDWLGAFLWAAGVVLLLNQYLFQAYRIPSRSMDETLLVKDRLFVNKFIYGPEILPGIGKLPGFREPSRGEVIIFENPEYISKGTAFDITQRVVFMLTLSIVDLDRDDSGNPAIHFLVKRGIGGYNDIVQFRKGEIYLKPEGEESFLHEEQFKYLSNSDYYSQRKIDEGYYTYIDSSLRNEIFSGSLRKGSNQFWHRKFSSNGYVDDYETELTASKYLSQLNPGDISSYQVYKQNSLGLYIPNGWILPIGDNRDNSVDGRFFGPVRKSEVLGKASFKFWPVSRVGLIR